MKKIILLASMAICTTIINAQIKINVEDAAKHVGDSVTVCTKIFGGKYLENSAKKITLLNAGGKYPDAPLTIVISGESRSNFIEKPEEFYRNKEVCITGKVTMFKDKPQIEVTSEAAIKVDSQ